MRNGQEVCPKMKHLTPLFPRRKQRKASRRKFEFLLTHTHKLHPPRRKGFKRTHNVALTQLAELPAHFATVLLAVPSRALACGIGKGIQKWQLTDLCPFAAEDLISSRPKQPSPSLTIASCHTARGAPPLELGHET